MRGTLTAALGGFLIPVTVVLAFNFSVDRYQYFRPWQGAQPIFVTNSRWQNPGLLRTYDYDAVIVGTSRSENFQQSMFDAAGWTIVKATAPGSSADEQLATLALALTVGRAKNTVVELSYYSFVVAHEPNPAFPAFLYEPSLETPFQYLASYDLLQQSLLVKNNLAASVSRDELNVWWFALQHEFGAHNVLEKLAKRCREAPPALLSPADMLAKVDRFEQLITGAPAVEFHGFFPPVAAISLATAPKALVTARLRFRETIAHIAERQPNFRVFDFAVARDIVTHLDRYKDVEHFDLAAQRQIALEISTGQPHAAAAKTVNGPLIELLEAIDEVPAACRAVQSVAGAADFQ